MSLTNKGHVYMTCEDCNCSEIPIYERDDYPPCPVCDWGLAVCKNCGKAESELEELCKPKTKQTDE